MRQFRPLVTVILEFKLIPLKSLTQVQVQTYLCVSLKVPQNQKVCFPS